MSHLFLQPFSANRKKFLTRLSTLFNARRTSNHGSVFLSQKRPSPPNPIKPTSSDSPTPSAVPFPDLHSTDPLPVLIRASDGKDDKNKKIRLSTVVQADDLEAFFVKYAECWKTGMSGLKKRDRSGRKAKAKGKKKKEKVGDGKKDQ